MDVTNDLMSDKSWNPNAVHSDFVHNIPPKRAAPAEKQYAQARKMSVKFGDDDNLKTDSFIDDMISVGPEIGDSISRLIAAPCKVLHEVSHKANTDTFILRDDIISNKKNEAEGAP